MSQSPKLTVEEMDIILPALIKVLKLKSNKNNPLHSERLLKWFESKKHLIGYKSTFSNVRLRKLVNHIRTNGLLPVISDHTGYYVSHDKITIIEMIQSLKSRIDSMQAAINGLENIMVELEMANQLEEFEVCDLGFKWDK